MTREGVGKYINLEFEESGMRGTKGKKLIKRVTAFIALSLLIMCLCSCEDTPSGPDFEGLFYPENEFPEDNTVSLQPRTSGEKFSIYVYLKEVTYEAVGSIRFSLRFRPDLVRYREHEEGDFFEQNEGAAAYAISYNEEVGELFAEVTLTEGEPATGTGSAVALKFKALAAGTSPFVFFDYALYDDEGTPISGIAWYGGSASIID